MTQSTIDFTVHTRENNSFSQSILDANKPRFSKQCKVVLDALLRGEFLTTTDALLKYSIGHLPRRIKDLRDSGINIQSITNEMRYNEYFICSDEIERLKSEGV